MARRALLIGSQTGGLLGVHADVELMQQALGAAGFATRTLTRAQAGRDGILRAYRELIEDCADRDAALVYYSGHGGRFRNPFADQDPHAPPYLQFIVPTDFDEAPGGSFRGILAEELALLQHELTARTPNVTSVLDCCHSARMSRDPALLPKALTRNGSYAAEAIRDLYLHAREAPGADAIQRDGNPLAVRLVACAPEQSAYELDLPDGSRHGALTARLAELVSHAETSRLTWRQLLDVLRPAVMDLVVLQRPEVEGPAERLLFSTEAREATGVLPIRVEAGMPYLEAATLFGIGAGDSYAVVTPGADPATSLGTAVVEAVAGDRARLILDGVTAADLPPAAEAHPLQIALGRRPVAVHPSDDPDRARVVSALGASPHLRIAREDDAGLLATLELADGAARLLDGQGEPLVATPVSLTDAGLRALDQSVQQLARAAHLRDLPSGTGQTELPRDVVVEYARVADDGSELRLDAAGEPLFAGDRLVVRVRNTGGQQRYASVFDIGLRGAISLLSESEPAGLSLAPGDEQVLYRTPAGVTGIELYWPEDLPRAGPRPESVITIITDQPQDLRRLTQRGVGVRGGEVPSPLQQMMDALNSGTRDARPQPAAVDAVCYRVHRFDFMLHPSARRDETEPDFEIDDRPDLSMRLIVPRAPSDAPSRVAVRLPEVVVHSNRAVLRSTVRIDALVVTQVESDDETPYQAKTERFDRVRDGDTLPLSNLLIYDGPVRRFLDVAIWVARDDKKGLDLAELFAKEAGSADVKGAIVTLAALAVAAPQAAVAAASVAAVAVIVRTGARLLDAAVGKSIGVYRTSLLPHERFGAGDPAARHPASGLLRAQDMSFAFEVVAL